VREKTLCVKNPGKLYVQESTAICRAEAACGSCLLKKNYLSLNFLIFYLSGSAIADPKYCVFKAYMTLKLHKIWVSKSSEYFMLISKLLRKTRKIGSLFGEKFLANNFFGYNFYEYFNGFKISITFCVF
jgi:hypothetical protein